MGILCWEGFVEQVFIMEWKWHRVIDGESSNYTGDEQICMKQIQ